MYDICYWYQIQFLKFPARKKVQLCIDDCACTYSREKWSPTLSDMFPLLCVDIPLSEGYAPEVINLTLSDMFPLLCVDIPLSEGYAPEVINLTFPFVKYTLGDLSQHSVPVCSNGRYWK